MTTQTHLDQNRAIAERAFADVLDGHDLERIPEYYAEDCRFYGLSGPEAIDRDEYASYLSMHFEAFPDLSFEVDDVVSADDRVAVRWTARGTHEGDLMDLPATGRDATVTGMSMLHFDGDRIVEVYSNQDMLGLLQQLDAVPDSPRKLVRLFVGRMKRRLADR